jgi:hypothetical protein
VPLDGSGGEVDGVEIVASRVRTPTMAGKIRIRASTGAS